MSTVDTLAPARAPGLELLGQMQDSGYQEAPSTVRRADGQTIQVTPLLYQLLEALDGERNHDEVAEALSESCGKLCSADDVRMLVDEKLMPLGLVCAPDGSAPNVRKQIPLLALRWKFVISDPQVTRRVTAPFAALFHRAIVIPVLLAFAATCFWVLFRHGLASGTRQAFDSPGLLLTVFLLTVVSAGWHEFGHAAACRAAGATPGAMGAGLYIVFPAFYTDVDDAHRLDRWGRLKVDLGGLYFNAVVAVAIMGAWLLTRTDALLLVVATQLLQMLRQLAPMIRADGYHILSDLIGVPDLFQHIKPTLAGLLPSNWGKPQPLRRGPRWVVRVWVLTIVPLLLWMLLGTALLLPRLIATAWVGLGQQQRMLNAGLQGGDVLAVGAALLQMFALALPVVAGVYMVGRVVHRTWRSAWDRTENHPGARGALMLLVGLIAAALALAWWPSGQYEPVSAEERGTISQAFQLSSFRSDQSAIAPSATRTTVATPIAGVSPQTGYALVPRQAGEETVLLVQDQDTDELRSIVTGGVADEGEAAGVAFPFALPAKPGVGDNQALAVNTEDGTVVYDVSVALVWVKDGEPLDNRNEAYALASCTNCTTVAVAFQVVLSVGETRAVAPINVSVAANGGCISCQTLAIAVQLVATLNETPSQEVQKQIEAALGRLDGITDLQALYDGIKTVERDIVTLLVDNGLIDESDVATSTDERSTSSTTTTLDGSSTSSTSTSTTSTTVRSTTTTSVGAGGTSASSSTTSTTSSSTTTSTPTSTTTTSPATTTTTERSTTTTQPAG